MPLPAGLDKYELKRNLVKSLDIDRFYHLRLEKNSSGLPLMIQHSERKSSVLDTGELFGSPDPIEVEIGCGKGGFMVEYCRNHPNQPFLGIEWEGQIAAYAAKRVAKRDELEHVRVILGDGYYLFRDFLPANCVKRFHIYFPDPWPKKRHHKKRMIRKEFLEQIQRLAIPDCELYFATDHLGYKEIALELFQSLNRMNLVEKEAQPIDGIMTNFEKKYREQGKPIHRSRWRISKSLNLCGS